jgi:hypothetical protein
MNKQQSPIYTTLWAFHPITQIINGVGLILGAQGFQESVMVIYWISQTQSPSIEREDDQIKLSA